MKPGDIVNSVYKIIGYVGRGAYGSVYKVIDTRDRAQKALKVDQIPENDMGIVREMDKLKHLEAFDYVIKYYDSFNIGFNLCMVIEYHELGDLKKFIKKEKYYDKDKKPLPTTIELIIKWSEQLLKALDFIHSKNIIHRDLKPTNILRSNNNEKIIVCDFGLAVSPETMTSKQKGTYTYMSPEIINNTDYDFKTDIWSLGCVIYELYTRQQVFQGELIDIITAVKECKIDLKLKLIHNNRVKFLIETMIVKDPISRMTAKEILHIYNRDNFVELNETFKKSCLEYEQCVVHEQKYNFEESKKSILNCIQMRESIFGSDKLSLAEAYGKLGEINLREYKISNAEENLTKSLNIKMNLFFLKQNDQIESLSFVNTLLNIGDCYYGYFTHEKALEQYLKALEINETRRKTLIYKVYKKTKDKNDLKELLSNDDNYLKEVKLTLAKVSNKIASCYLVLNKFDLSLEHSVNSKKIYQKLQMTESMDYAIALSCSGESLVGLGQIDKGLEDLNKSLIIKRKFPNESLSLIRTMVTLADIYEIKNDAEKSKKLMEESNLIRNNFLPNLNHPDLTSSINSIKTEIKIQPTPNTNGINSSLEDPNENEDEDSNSNSSEPNFNIEKLPGMKSNTTPSYETSQFDLKSVLNSSISQEPPYNVDKFKKALEWNLKSYKRLLSLNETLDHKLALILVQYNIGVCYRRLDNNELALGYLKDSLKLLDNLAGDNENWVRKLTADVAYEIGLICDRYNNLTKAYTYFKLSYDKRNQKTQTEDLIGLARSLNAIGICLEKMNNLSEALRYFLKSIDLKRKFYGQIDHEEIARSLFNIGVCYERLNEFERALTYCQNSLMMRKRLNNDLPNIDSIYSLNSVAICWIRMREIKSGIDIFNESYNECKRLLTNYPRSILLFKISAIITSNISIVYSKLASNQPIDQSNL